MKNLVRYEIKNALNKNLIILILLVVSTFCACMYFNNKINDTYRSYEELLKNPNFVKVHNDVNLSDYEGGSIEDYQLFLFGGMPKVDLEELKKGRQIEIPAIYLIIAVCITFITQRALFNIGNNYSIIYSRKRTMWMLSKIITNIFLVIIVYLIVMIMGLCFSNRTLDVNKIICRIILDLNSVRFDYTDWFKFFSFVFVIPCVSAIAISQIQITISMFTSSIVGFISSLSIYVLSVFYNSVFFLGNGCMAQRTVLFSESGLSIYRIILVDLVVIIVSVILNIVWIKHKNFYFTHS